MNFEYYKDEKAHTYVVRGEKREIDREQICCENYGILLGFLQLHIKGFAKKVTHQGLPSASITPKSMTYRDTAYIKARFDK